ncbi:MAG: LpqB family beta-propeller domain-containing protein [Calditrichia bacterium]
MPSVRTSVFALTFLLSFLLLSSGLMAQVGYQFGQNKVHYKDFDWKVFRTEHFDVHYYPEEEQAAYDAARMAERGYDYLSEVLEHDIKKRIPLILYASLNDFQQTNVISGFIGEGTRGVTESLKNRVVLPITGSYREFNHVLVHELVHAFQFDIMALKLTSTRSNVPLWVVEGMAEYLSNNMDNITRMWVRDGLERDKLLTVKQLNGTFDIRVYRLGQSFWHYIGETYGKEKVGAIFKSAIHQGGFDQALKKHISKNEKEVTKDWHAYAKANALPGDSTLQSPSDIAQQITRQRSFYHRMNVVPSISPDGEHVAYIANQNLKEEIYLLSEDNNASFVDQRLIKGGDSKSFEALRYFDTAIGWARDGKKIAFVSKSGQDDAIYIMDPHSRKVLQRFIFDELNGLQSPTFSPEGNRIAFVGIRGGISNLYLLDLDSGALDQRTDDRYAVLHPQWSPDGGSIAFTTDRGPDANEAELIFSDYDIARYHLSTGNVELLTDLQGSVTNPQLSPDGETVAFVSDHQGIANIYRMNIGSRELQRLTSFKNGISGITNTTPSFSWSANGERMVFSAFYDNAWHLFRLNAKQIEELAAETPSVTLDPVSEITKAAMANKEPRPIKEMVSTSDSMLAINNEDSTLGEAEVIASSESDWIPELADQNDIYRSYELEEPDSVESTNYRKRFKLDAVGVGGSVGGFFGSVGAAQFLFSDMLGDHSVILSTEVSFSDFSSSDFGLTYFNQANRISWGVQAFQTSNIFSVFRTGINSLGYLRNTYRGVNAVAAYPFSKFSRLEVSGGFTWVDQNLVQDNFSNRGIDRDVETLNSFTYGQVGTALVFDNTLYGPVGPTGGSRSRFSVETTTSDFQFTNLQADYRKYFQLPGRSVLAYRATAAASLGEDERIFGLGGPYTYRGADFNEILGSKFVLSNLEYRFPLFGFLTPRLDLISGAAFFDAAGAWGIDAPGLISETFQPFTADGGFRLNDLNAAYGVGARVSLGYFYLGYDVAWPTDLKDISAPVSQFSLGTFF